MVLVLGAMEGGGLTVGGSVVEIDGIEGFQMGF